MKITKRQLRRIISEAAAQRTIELTDPSVTEAQINDAWPRGVTHNGKIVFDTFYSNSAMAAANRFVNDEGYSDTQEAYLGYDPDSDTFVMGFDAFSDEEDEYGYADYGGSMESLAISLSDDGHPLDVIGSFPGGMYPEGLRGIRAALPSIIDIRLD